MKVEIGSVWRYVGPAEYSRVLRAPYSEPIDRRWRRVKEIRKHRPLGIECAFFDETTTPVCAIGPDGKPAFPQDWENRTEWANRIVQDAIKAPEVANG